MLLFALLDKNKYIFKQSNIRLHHSVHKFSMMNTAKPLEAKPREAKHICVLIFPNYIFIFSPYLRILLPIIAFLSDF